MKRLFLMLIAIVFMTQGIAIAGNFVEILGEDSVGVEHQVMVTAGRRLAVDTVISAATVTVTGVVTTEGSYDILDLTVPVSASSATVVFTSTGILRHCSLVPAVNNTTYDFEIFTNDAIEYPIMGKAGLLGKTGLMAARVVAGSHIAKFENVVSSGTYRARCVILK